MVGKVMCWPGKPWSPLFVEKEQEGKVIKTPLALEDFYKNILPQFSEPGFKEKKIKLAGGDELFVKKEDNGLKVEFWPSDMSLPELKSSLLGPVWAVADYDAESGDLSKHSVFKVSDLAHYESTFSKIYVSCLGEDYALPYEVFESEGETVGVISPFKDNIKPVMKDDADALTFDEKIELLSDPAFAKGMCLLFVLEAFDAHGENIQVGKGGHGVAHPVFLDFERHAAPFMQSAGLLEEEKPGERKEPLESPYSFDLEDSLFSSCSSASLSPLSMPCPSPDVAVTPSQAFWDLDETVRGHREGHCMWAGLSSLRKVLENNPKAIQETFKGNLKQAWNELKSELPAAIIEHVDSSRFPELKGRLLANCGMAEAAMSRLLGLTAVPTLSLSGQGAFSATVLGDGGGRRLEGVFTEELEV